MQRQTKFFLQHILCAFRDFPRFDFNANVRHIDLERLPEDDLNF